jgi:hypothetical protein
MFVTYRLEFHDQNFWSEETGEQGGEEVVVLGPRSSKRSRRTTLLPSNPRWKRKQKGCGLMVSSNQTECDDHRTELKGGKLEYTDGG